MSNVKIGVDIDAKINQSINGQIDKLERKFAEVQSMANKTGFGEKIKDEVQSAKAEISQLREDFKSVYSDFKNQKLDNSEFENFVKSTKSMIDELNTRVTDVEGSLKRMESLFRAAPNSSAFEKRLNALQTQINDFVEQTQNAISVLTDFNRMVNKTPDAKTKGNNTEVKDKVEQEVTSFSFKKGGIKVPVTLDKDQMSKLQNRYNELVSTLQEYADKHPVDVTMRLFPLNTTKAGAKEVTEAVKNIQAQITKLPEGEFKESAVSLYNDLEKQYQKAVRLNVDVRLSEDQQSIKARIKELSDAVKEQGFVVTPKFDIDDTDADAISEKLSELQNKITLKAVTNIKLMSDSLTNLFDKSDVQKWTDSFIKGLDEINTKLMSITPLMQQLNGSESKEAGGKKKNKNVPDEKDVNVLVEFTNAMKALRDSLKQHQSAELTIDIEPLMEKLEVLKATIVMVHSGIGNLQSTLSNVKNTGGLQLILETLQKIENIINEINVGKDTLKFKLDTDINTQDFINDIQSKISASEGVKVPISVLEGSIDSFIQQIQFAVDSRLTNGDIGVDSFIPPQDYKTEGDKVTGLNRRIGNLKEKIESVWESWYQFAQGAISGTSTAKEGITGVINKLEELSWALQSVSSGFNNIDFSKQIGDIGNLLKLVDINESAGTSASNISKEAMAMSEVYEKALQAAEAKSKFAGANKEVLESIIGSLSALNSEGKGFENLNKLINNLARNKDDRITDMVANLELLRDALSAPIDDNSFIKAIQDIASQEDGLRNLATVLSATKKQIQNAKTKTNNNSEENESDKNEQENEKKYLQLKREELELQRQLIQLRNQGYGENTKSVSLVKERLAFIQDEITKNEQLYDSEKKVDKLRSQSKNENYKQELDMAKQQEANQKRNYTSQLALLKQVNSWINQNSVAYKEYGDRLDQVTSALKSNVTLTTEELTNVRNAFRQIVADAEAAGKTGIGLSESIKQRFQSLASYTATFTSLYDFIRYAKSFVSMIKDFDVNLTEMRKVSDETVATLKDFQKESFGIADAVGSTADVIQDSTADWMRLGEAIDEAKESAKDASILMNVSEFSSIDEATTSLVAMSQAYQDMDKIDIIDKLNNIGNNYSISTDQLATGLQNAAAVLKTQGNDIDKSIALLTAANSVVQDISKASTGIRTISLRIAGTEEAKAELQEMGDDVEDYIVQTASKTQQTIKNYTATALNPEGVDVLDSNGNLRDTYEILLDIAKVYATIQEEDKQFGTNRANALVEFIAGKNRSNIAASILNDPKLLEDVYQSSQNSEGSAMEENQKYLESIEGRMNRLKNKWQEVWTSDEVSDSIKNLLDILENALDTGSIDKFTEGLKNIIGFIDDLVYHGSALKTTLVAIFSPKIASSIKDMINNFNSLVSATKDFARTGSLLSKASEINKSMLFDNEGNQLFKNLSEMSNLSLPTETIDQYRKMLHDVSAEEAAYVLSSQNMTQDQARQVFFEDGIAALNNYTNEEIEAALQEQNWITTKKLLTAEEKEQLITNELLTETQVEELTSIEGLQLAQDGSIVTTKKLTREKMKQALAEQGIVGPQAEEILSTMGLTTAQSAGTLVTNLYTRAINELKIALTSNPLTIPIMAITAAITLTVGAISKYVDINKEMVESINSASKELSDSRQQISDYKDEISDLREVLNNQESSVDDVKEATSRLYEIQSDLISTYGSYASGIDLVNGSLEEQLGLLTKINEQNAKKWENEVNSSYSGKTAFTNFIGNSLINFFDPRQSLHLIKKTFENVHNGEGLFKSIEKAYSGENYRNEVYGETLWGTTLEQARKEYENFTDSIDASSSKELNKFINSLEGFSVKGNKIEISGKVDDITESITRLQIEMEKLGVEDKGLERQLLGTYKKAQKINDDFGETVRNGYYYDIVSNKDTLKYYNNLEDAYYAYQDAVSKGNEDLIQETQQAFVNELTNIDLSNMSDTYKNYLMDMYDDMQGIVSDWKLDKIVNNELKSLQNVDEYRKLSDWGLSKYEDDLRSGKLHQFGNIDMDKRAIIQWSDELKQTYKEELASWDYDPEIGSIDSVFGGSDSFVFNDTEHEIAFSPILQTEDGKGKFLSRETVNEYINDVLTLAGKDGNIDFQEVLDIDAEGTGKKIGGELIHGIIAGIDNYGGISAEDIGGLMHFSGKAGAMNLAQSNMENIEHYIASNSLEKINSDYTKFINNPDDLGKPTIDLLTDIETWADSAGLSVEELINALKQLDSFDYSEARAKLKDSSVYNKDKPFETTAIDAVREYKQAVADYEAFEYKGRKADKSIAYNSHEKDANGFKARSTYKVDDDLGFIITPKMVDINGNEKDISQSEIDNYMNHLIDIATEGGKKELNIDLIKQADAEGYVDQFGNHIDHMINDIGSFSDSVFADEYNYIEKNNEVIYARAEAFKTMYTEASAAGVTVKELEEAFDTGLNWDDERIDKFLSTLSDEQLPILLDIGIDELSAVESEEELREIIRERQKIADENAIELTLENKVNSADAVKSLNDLESDWSGLDTVYQSTVSTAGGVAEAKDIETVNSNMGGIKDAEGNYTAMANALEAYNDALVENKGDSEAAQEATDRLATAYIDQSGILDNLQESNADYYIEMLKARGVTNAEEVVMSRLTKTAKMSAKAMAELSKTVAKYRDELDNGSLFDNAIKGDSDAKTAIGDIKSQLKDMLTMYDESGNAIEMPEFDTSFIRENLADIEAAVEGDIDAVDRLRMAAAKVSASKVDIGVNVPTEVAEQNLNKMMEQVVGIDAMDIEVGASIDDGPFIATLTEMIHAGQTSADQVAAAFESMGYTVTWTPHPYTVEYLEANQHNIKDTKAFSAMMQKAQAQIDVPELTITRRSSGTGAKTNFGGAPTTGNGGKGGGGDNTSKEDSNDIENDSLTKSDKDTFDWIEVKLQRLEEAVKKLDRQVQNTFKNWTHRNKSLGNEIAKVTEQIKAQEDASKSYADHAKKDVKVATPEEPDYKGDLKKQNQAEKEFDKWKKKVRDGKVTDAKILEIKNSFLRDAVFEYKKRYNSGDKEVKKTASDVKVREVNIDDYNTQQYAYEKKLSDEAKKIWKSGKYQDLVQQGKIFGKDIEKISNQYLANAIKEYQELWQKSLDAKDTAEELRIQLSELNKQNFDNLTTQLEEVNGLLEKQLDLIDKRIERTELKGFFVDKSYYEQQIKLTEEEIENTQNTLNKHVNALNYQLGLGIDNGGVENGSTEWNDMVQQIMEDNNQLEELNNHILELRDNIKQVEWEKFSWLEERLKRINAEADHIIKFLTVNEIYEENGNFKNTGWGNAALVAAQYNNAFAEAERYANEYNEWRTKMNNRTDGASWNNTKDVEHLEELKDGWWAAKEALVDYMQAMKTLVEGAINKHLENLQEVINKYKEALSSAKDLYDFQKNIANQTKQIESLQKQLRAVQGDDSESARKRRQELTNQLESAQQQLQETEWDRYISQTGEMLDDLYEDYEELLNARLDDIIDLMKDMVTEINNNSGNVREGIKVMLQQFGISTDQLEYFESFAKDNNKDLLSAINDGKLVNSNTVMSKTLEEAKGYLDTIADTTTKIGEILSGSKTIRYDSTTGVVSVVDAKSSSNSGGASNGGNGSNAKSGGNNSGNANTQNDKAYKQGQIEATKKDLSKYTKQLKNDQEKLTAYITTNRGKYNQLQKKKNPTQAEKNWLYTYDNQVRVYENNIKDDKLQLENLEKKLQQLSAYATGTRRVPHDQLAWTQEEGSEVIFRKSDGAMLTPLGQGDMVFTNEMSKTLWAIAKGGIPTNANIIVPDISGNRNTTVTANNEITITLPNVQDYASFKHDLQNDDNFEKFIQEVTIGQVWGNNKLNKRKY